MAARLEPVQKHSLPPPDSTFVNDMFHAAQVRWTTCQITTVQMHARLPNHACLFCAPPQLGLTPAQRANCRREGAAATATPWVADSSTTEESGPPPKTLIAPPSLWRERRRALVDCATGCADYGDWQRSRSHRIQFRANLDQLSSN